MLKRGIPRDDMGIRYGGREDMCTNRMWRKNMLRKESWTEEIWKKANLREKTCYE